MIMARRDRHERPEWYPGPGVNVVEPPKPTYETELNGVNIVHYMNNNSTEKYDVAWYTMHFKGKKATLKKVAIATLRPLIVCSRNAEIITRYQRNPENRPPIVVESGVILDGAHRWLSALANGEEEINAYVVE